MKLILKKGICVVLTLTVIMSSCAISTFAASAYVENIDGAELTDTLTKDLGNLEIQSQERKVVTTEKTNIVLEDLYKNSVVKTQTIDGVEYDIIVKECSEETKIASIVNKETGDFSYVTFDKQSMQIDKFYGRNNDYLVETAVIDIPKSENNILASETINYKTKVMEQYKNKYWYQRGYSATKDYLKIGCVATYKLNLSSLSSTRVGRCNAYIKAIDTCNSKMKAADRAIAGTSISFVVVWGLLMANIACPPTTIVTLIASAAGGLSLTQAWDFVNAGLDAKDAYNNAVDIYAEIKVFGTKLESV